MLDPRPLLTQGHGLIGTFPWLAAGIAGMVAALAAGARGEREAPLLVAGTAAAELALMLCYRDLHPTELWRFELYHYFTWLLPIGALYGVVLLRALLRPGRAWAAVAALATVPALFMWRADLADPRPLPASLDGIIALPQGLQHLDAALLVPAATDWDRADADAGFLAWNGGQTRRLADLKGYPLDGAFLVVPLRRLPSRPGEFHANPALRLDQAAPPLLVRQRIVWGLPCFVWPDRLACEQFLLRPPPALTRETIEFGPNAGADAWMTSGWSHPEPAGRWTDGDAAVLRLRLPASAVGAAGVALTLVAHGYVPPGTAPAGVALFANGRPVARWSVGEAPGALHAVIPAALLGPPVIGQDRGLALRLAIDDPRRPIDYNAGPDGRRLGLFVFRLTVTPAPADRPSTYRP